MSGLQWVVDSYALALASLMLAGGTVGDIYGHRRVVLAGLVVFGLGSLGCGLASSVSALVSARAIQGAGAAMLLPGTLAIITHAYAPGAAQARAIGLWAGIGSLALPAGPLLGGALISGLGWRAIFLINVPIVLFALIAAARLVKDSAEPQGRRLDAGGILLGMLFLIAVTFAFIEAGRTGARSAPAIAAAACAVVLAVVFLRVEHGRRSEAMLPVALFRRPAFTVAGDRRAARGTAHQPNRTTPPIAAGLLVSGLGIALLTRVVARSSYLAARPAFMLWGTGLGILTPAVVAAAIAAVPRGRAGLASAINNTARQAGGAIGIAIAGAIAGPPSDQHSFVGGFHVIALAAAALYLIAAILAPRADPGHIQRVWHYQRRRPTPVSANRLSVGGETSRSVSGFHPHCPQDQEEPVGSSWSCSGLVSALRDCAPRMLGLDVDRRTLGLVALDRTQRRRVTAGVR